MAARKSDALEDQALEAERLDLTRSAGAHPRIPSPPGLRRAASSLGRRSLSEGGKSEGMLRSKALLTRSGAPAGRLTHLTSRVSNLNVRRDDVCGDGGAGGHGDDARRGDGR